MIDKSAAPAVSMTFVVLWMLQTSPQGQQPRLVFPRPVRISAEQSSILVTARNAFSPRAAKIREMLFSLGSGVAADRPTKIPLSEALADERDAVSRVATVFGAASSTGDERAAADVFFGDFVRRYDRSSKQFATLKYDELERFRQDTFGLLDDTANAYEEVRAFNSLTFDLDVNSTPPQADVSFRRVGDSYTKHPDRTTTTIKNLVFAVWFVRAELNQKNQEKEHNPFRQPNHVVHFDF
jgi:hypothetical protein